MRTFLQTAGPGTSALAYTGNSLADKTVGIGDGSNFLGGNGVVNGSIGAAAVLLLVDGRQG